MKIQQFYLKKNTQKLHAPDKCSNFRMITSCGAQLQAHNNPYDNLRSMHKCFKIAASKLTVFCNENSSMNCFRILHHVSRHGYENKQQQQTTLKQKRRVIATARSDFAQNVCFVGWRDSRMNDSKLCVLCISKQHTFNSKTDSFRPSTLLCSSGCSGRNCTFEHVNVNGERRNSAEIITLIFLHSQTVNNCKSKTITKHLKQGKW